MRSLNERKTEGIARETSAELGKLWLQNYAWKDTIIVERQRATIKGQSSSLCQRAIGLLLIRISFQCSNWFPVAVGPRNILPSNWSSVLWAFSFFTATKRLVWWRIPTGMWKVRVSLKTGLPLGSFVRVFFCFSTLLSWMRDTSTYAARKEIMQGQLALKNNNDSCNIFNQTRQIKVKNERFKLFQKT